MSPRPLVLVADDDPDILLLMTLTLERDGYDVVAAKDGLGALEAAVERVPHLVLLDLMMPGLDGYEVTRRLRLEPATKDLPIVIVTAAAEESQAARALDAGADAYMKKPFSPRELLAKTAALILERRPRSRLASA
ncbi:MAG TPA: response regulator [Gaiellaceae bacterium]|nr:response regulator [Gaiellaceae bacterium]